jgi:hypothetical protein
MQTRTKEESVTFGREFSLPGLDRSYPAGTYTVRIEEERLEQMSFLAYHRLSTSLRLPVPGGGSASYQMVPVDPADLDAALRRDAGAAA